MTTNAPDLPALRVPRRPFRPAELRPTVVVDTREQDPLPISRLPSVRGTLTSGDYSVLGLEDLFAVERKSVADLVACCVGDNRDRLSRELHRLRGCRFARLLVVGTREQIERADYRSRIVPSAVLHSLAAWEARFIPVVFSDTPEDAARLVESWAYWFSREVLLATSALAKCSAVEADRKDEAP